MFEEIRRRLSRIESEEDVRILYACESGSRAWGFASGNSDWDVRFIYARRPEWYLSVDLEKKRDVIELPIVDDLDVNGWDIRKALRLYRGSNPPLFEWVHSPIVYHAHTDFIARLRGGLRAYYSLKSCHYHYLSMARKNYREYLQGERVRLKKYLYVLRPLLAVMWLEQGRGRVPVEFAVLLDCLGDIRVKAEIDSLVQRKIQGDELAQGARIDVLNRFIDGELERLDRIEPPAADASEVEPLNRIFRETLIAAWA
ncbi:nucleotidyltransferase domain-containing protein [Desulfovibrio aminophilus]|nr:nucleotidyltransferase domain-containing protein [Desulfovibrio aminophilus]MCM0755966.1 nucleotidyltransferase domain-containing protein [Desulfovibrio aminophilus]